ncbi:MAG: type III-A CRISPR-associated protein Cas10/Csm1, partial [Anaerolineae bacterium]|nr:type III-A CRISPR-associated protein Cas10/Csm1 [Anaerolineae bacterium]
METERILLDALAGLWHDIGKFAQRSGEGTHELWNQEAERDIGYRHALASDGFLGRHVPRQWQAQLAGVRYHHRPASARLISDEAYRQACLVQVADWLSSEEREASTEAGEARLRSPLSRLAGYDAPWYFRLEPLSGCSEAIFPELLTEGQGVPNRAYRALWEQFEHASSVLCSDGVHKMDLRAFTETAYFLLQEYAWCVPSAYYGQVPDVSLFDHARTTAAIAACLTADDRDADWINRLREALLVSDGDILDEPVAVLVGGDLTGLQRFLYTIASENAAKSLRGRSVYLQLLSEVVAEYVLDRLGLPLTNLLYVGGGTFYLLVQTTWQGVASDQRLRAIQREIAEKLVKAHGGALGLALAFMPITSREFAKERFHEAWDRLHQKIRRQKEFLLGGLDARDLARLIGSGMGLGGEIGFCEVCGEETPDKAAGSGCSLCKSLEELGMQVARANYLLLAEINDTSEQQVSDFSWHTVVESFGRRVYFLENLDEIGNIARDIRDRAARIRLLWLSEREEDLADRVRSLGIRVPISLGYRPFAQLVPWCDADRR